MSRTVEECPSCGKHLNRSSDLYEIDGMFVCEKCFREWLADYAKSYTSDAAGRMGVPVLKFDEMNFGG